MGQITPAVRASYGRHAYIADWIPAQVLERIDQAEVLDRLDEAVDLIRKAERATPDLSQGYRDRVRLVLAAEPRDDVEREATEWLAKADAAHTPSHASGLRAQAKQVRDKNPSAPRRHAASSTESVARAQVKEVIRAEVAKCMAKQARSTDLLAARLEGLKTQVADMTKAQRPDLLKAAQ
ncbi:hypothetical protein AB0E08_10910 [Streptomyces sp. NPDC048281]|uniref:hypothetical protein n=1 Tax=Streptomyces sp. NPDC048281 TaxID=3154715 RepID=UPI00341D044B